MNLFLYGVLCMASSLVGLFFLRYWSLSRDRLFIFFALAFWILALHWLMIAVVDVSTEIRPYFYIPRLLAFLLILIAIIDKNRRAPRS
jgi:hypothetical protein